MMTPYIRKLLLRALAPRSVPHVTTHAQTWSTLQGKPRRRAMLAKRDIEYHNAASHDDASAFRRRQIERVREHWMNKLRGNPRLFMAGKDSAPPTGGSGS